MPGGASRVGSDGLLRSGPAPSGSPPQDSRSAARYRLSRPSRLLFRRHTSVDRLHDRATVSTVRTLFASTLLLLVVSSFVFATSALEWDQSLYAKFDHESFSNSKLAKQTIDFGDVDYFLLHAAVFFETNRVRLLHDLPPFIHSPALEKIAHEHSREMAARGFFSHDSVVRGRETMAKRMAGIGITNAHAAENIAYVSALEYEAGKPVFTPVQNGGYFSYTYKGERLPNRTYLSVARALLSGWMSSPLHRGNILNADYTYLGVGVAYYINESSSGMPHFKATQNFASVPGQYPKE